MEESFIHLALVSEERYRELVNEFEENLGRKLDKKEQHFIEFIIEQELGVHENEHTY
ncbi:MAG: hypothetical protein WBV93_05190 [Anaerobacillus sp.]